MKVFLLQVVCPLYNIIGNKLPVHVLLIFGTKINIFWDFGGNNTAVQVRGGSGKRSFDFEQDINTTGQVNVTVEASNVVSSARNSTSLFYFFPIAGFYIQNNITVQTTEMASIFF